MAVVVAMAVRMPMVMGVRRMVVIVVGVGHRSLCLTARLLDQCSAISSVSSRLSRSGKLGPIRTDLFGNRGGYGSRTSRLCDFPG